MAITKRQLSENRNFLAVIEDTRRREAYQFETDTTSYQLTSQAVDEALVIIEEIWAGESSFVELAKHSNAMLKAAVKVRMAHHMASVMSAFA